MSPRRGTPAATVAGRLVPPLTAVGAVVAVIVILLFLNGRATQSASMGPAVAASRASTSGGLARRAAVRPATPRPAPRSAAAPQVRPRRARVRPVVRLLPVTVLNNSRITGLAHAAADEIARRGWPIAYIGNFTGRIRASTIYYAPGQLAVARAFARRFRAVERVLPRFPGLPGEGLTLVVTRYWPH